MMHWNEIDQALHHCLWLPYLRAETSGDSLEAASGSCDATGLMRNRSDRDDGQRIWSGNASIERITSNAADGISGESGPRS